MRPIDGDALKNIHGMKDDCAECDKELRHKSRSCEFDRVYTLMDFCGWIDDAPTIEPEQRWIPVTERLPEEEYVLISKKPTKISGDKWSVTIAIRTADPRSRKIQWRDSGFGVIQDDKVLAWMPLPYPYGGEQE